MIIKKSAVKTNQIPAKLCHINKPKYIKINKQDGIITIQSGKSSLKGGQTCNVAYDSYQD